MNTNYVSLKKLVRQLATTTLALTGFTHQLLAQDSTSLTVPSSTINLDEVIISVSRIEQQPDEVGRSISVISTDDIKNSTATNVSELLSQQEGIYIVGAGQTPGSQQSLFLRGANSEHTVILIDGVRITDPSSVDNSINLAELSLATIDRIEIVRGSHSTLYGSSAIGGVVNIITKSKAKTGFSGGIESTIGTFGESSLDLSESINLNYAHKSGLYIRGEVFNTNVKGIDATSDTVTDPDVFKNRDQDNFDKLDLIGKVGYKNEKWDVFTSYKITDQLLDIDDGAYTDDDNYTVDFKRNLLSYKAAYKIKPSLEITFLGGLTEMERAAIDDSSIVDNEGTFDHTYSSSFYKGSTSNNELQASYKLRNSSFVIGGGNYRETMTSQSYYTNVAWDYTSESDLDSLEIEATTNSVFFIADLNGELISSKLNKLDLGLGYRFNNHSSFGTSNTFEVNPSYSFNESAIIYGAWSTGFNAPALYRIYSPNENTISNVTRGNKELQAETSTSFEIGFKQKVNKRTSITLAVFQTKVDNLIEYVYLWDKAIGIDTLGNDWTRSDHLGDTYLNIGEQTNRGFELGFKTELTNKFHVNGNVSIVNGKLNYAPSQSSYTDNYHVQLFATGDFLSKEIESYGLVRRSNTANLRLLYKANKKLSFASNIRYAGVRNDIYYNSELGPWGALGQQKVGDYTLVDFTINYKVLENLQATFTVNNAFNVDYQEIYGYATKGRGIYFKVNYTL